MVLGIIGGAGLAARKIGLGYFVKASHPRARLQIVETLGIAPRQRLLIVRRDNVEHSSCPVLFFFFFFFFFSTAPRSFETNIPAQPMPITEQLP